MHGNPRVGENLPTAGDRLLRVVSDCLGTDCILVLGDCRGSPEPWKPGGSLTFTDSWSMLGWTIWESVNVRANQ